MKRNIVALLTSIALLVALVGASLVVADELNTSDSPSHIIADSCSSSGGGC
jgi:hypothetical protein